MYLKRQFAKNDLDCAVLGCYLDLSTTDKEKLKQVTNRYLAHIRFASLLGCGVVGTETGFVGERVTVIDEAIALLGPDVAVIHIKDYRVVDGMMRRRNI